MNFREQYTLMYHSNIFMIMHGHIISYTFVNSFFPPRYMQIYFTASIIFSAVVPQTLRIMQAAYGLYITLNSILHYAYWVEVHRAVHHKHSILFTISGSMLNLSYFGNLTTPEEGAEHHPLYNTTLSITPPSL